ncbi:hypothetical protein Poli38472_009856 [Pythium oligandrum]|uniref:Uncharacterized protein n=1 Tax=Pythium oligandrum TaxID=41045 RepID=A0A8K1CH20_PYTOL|nr:hypothetical protein Poli38472_009856 [Pythium oligandrum]|eukprot:TMW62363.1 hypothetical protein Poli38472_009856 [Pythium oligandrum]
MTLWSTVNEFFDGDEHRVDDDEYVAVVRPQVNRHGRALSRTDSSNSTPSEENEGLSHATTAYETSRWSFAQWMTSVVDRVSTDDAIVAKKCE